MNKTLLNRIISINLYTHIIFLNLVSLLFVYWKEGGRFLNCFGFNNRLDEYLCQIIETDNFFILAIFLILWSTVLSLFIYIQRNKDLALFLLKQTRVFLLPLLVIFVFGFINFGFCLFGCINVYFWPITIPLLVVYFIFNLLYNSFFCKNLPNKDSSFWKLFAKNTLILLVSALYVALNVMFGEYIADSDLFRVDEISGKKTIQYSELGIVEIVFNPDTGKTYTKHNYLILQRYFLAAEQRYTKLAVLDDKREVVKPLFLREISSEGISRYKSNSKDYFVEDGIIYAGSYSTYPFEYYIEGVSAGLTSLQLFFSGEEIKKIEKVPIMRGTKIYIKVYIEDEKRKIGNMRFDFDGNGVIDSEISFDDEFDRLGLLREALSVELDKTKLDNQKKLNVLDSYDRKQYKETLKLLSESSESALLYDIQEVIAALILNT